MQEPQSLPTAPGQNAGRVPFSAGTEVNSDPALGRAMTEAARKRNNERQKRLVADTDRLVRLAQDLYAAVEASGESRSPVSMAKKSEEIEKLAKSVGERMKSE